MRLTDGTGKSLTLGRQLGSGGEGTVYELQGSAYVVKLYNKSISSEKADKLRAMVRASSSELLDIAAWPKDLVLKDGRLSGLVMPRVTGLDIHQLYGPAQRKVVFPRADWAFLVHTARNVSAAVQDIHKNGHVIGDVNQGNFKVSEQATVKLIDCDSFQIKSNGRLYVCEVGVPDFTPPELQGEKSFATVIRTPNHDNFGLAVLVFHLLFMGRHPFVGRFSGKGEMPVEKAIREYRFAYGPEAAIHNMAPPPFALPLEAASGSIANLFQRAFSYKSAQAGRPTAKEWVQALDGLEKNLKRCREGHYSLSISNCPWCNFENQGQYFFLSFPKNPTSTFDLLCVRNAIESIRLNDHSITYSISSSQLPSAPMPRRHRQLRLAMDLASASVILSIIAVIAGATPLILLACVIYWFVLVVATPYGRLMWRLRLDSDSAKKESRRRQDGFKNEHNSRRTTFERKLAELRNVLTEHSKLVTDCNLEKQKLQSDKHQYQLRQFLSRFVIESSRIKDIGPARSATLRSWNIETAADVTPQKIAGVPGFGPTRTNALLTWRKNVERQFRFDPNRAVAPSEIALIEQKYQRRRRDLENALTAGVEQLEKIRSHDDQQARIYSNEINGLAIKQAKLKADLRAYRWW